jgi:hypothetical protein
MRTVYAATLTIGVATLLGCGGGSPTTRVTTGTVEYDVYPTDVLVIEPGQSKDMKVSRKGGEAKDVDLTVTSSDPKVRVEGGKFKGDAKEATVTVKADPDAPAREHTITIKAGDVTKTVHVRVEPAGGGSGANRGGTPGSATTPTGRAATSATRKS